MRKIILVFLIIITIVSFGYCGYNYLEYEKSKEITEEDLIKDKKNLLKKKNEEIVEIEEEIKKVKGENSSKVETLELWEKELEKVKKSS